LHERGIELTPPASLRVAELAHPSGGTWPAMVAIVTRGRDNAPLGVHRTYLARDGSGKAPVEPAKMMLAGRRRRRAPGTLG
jgi:hypothetical protein